MLSVEDPGENYLVFVSKLLNKIKYTTYKQQSREYTSYLGGNLPSPPLLSIHGQSRTLILTFHLIYLVAQGKCRKEKSLNKLDHYFSEPSKNCQL